MTAGASRVRVAGAIAPVLLALASACRVDGDATAALVRDSAGIRIVESHAPRWSAEEAWTVRPEPLLSIGSVDGPPERSFARVLAAFRTATGDLAVFDGTANELRFFDAEGRFLRSVGRPGAGPGEFQRVLAAGVAGDSIWLYDRGRGRLTFVDGRTGGFRVVPVEARNLGLGSAGRLSDGSLVFAAHVALTEEEGDLPPPGMHRWGAVYLRIGPQGRTLDTLLRAPGAERLLQYGDGTIELLRPLFARSVSHAARGGRIVYGDQERYELRVYDADGMLRRLMRRSDVDPTLREQAFEDAVEKRVRAAPEPARPGLRRLYEAQPTPSTRPAYAQLLFDAEGRLWVQDYAVDGDARSWSVFDQDGAWMGDVTFPPRFRPTQILSDEVVGVWRNELDVEHVRVYGLHKTANSH